MYVTILAVALGILAGAIDEAVDFLSDTRFGYCNHGVFLSKKLCCDQSEDADDCASWIDWHTAFRVDDKFYYSLLIDYLMYIIFGAVYAGMAALGVKSLAHWAAGSGLPEVKTILGGFVISKFNSWQTLLVKLSGVVNIYCLFFLIFPETKLLFLFFENQNFKPLGILFLILGE